MHQFQKVEQVVLDIADPQRSIEHHEMIVRNAEDVLQAARKYLRPENRTVVSLQPVSQAEHDELGEIE